MERLKAFSLTARKQNWLETVITSTTDKISSARNVYMLHKFLINAPGKLIPGSGKVEIIVSTSYLERWPIVKIAQDMGYIATVDKNYDLGFENVKTQKGEKVKESAPPEKCLITLYLPWGEALYKRSTLTWVDSFTEYTTRQPSLLYSIDAPD